MSRNSKKQVDDRKKELLYSYEAGNDSVYEEALELFEKSLKEKPQDPELLVDFGYLLECRGRTLIRKAANMFEKAIKIKPEFSLARKRAMMARAALFESNKAIEMYKERIEKYPEDVQEYKYLIKAYLLANQYREAKKVVETALEIKPDDPGLIENYGSVYAGLEEPEKALKYWDKAFELDSENISTRYSTAFLLEREGRLKEAIEQWNLIIKWLTERNYNENVDWPKQEIERIKKKLK